MLIFPDHRLTFLATPKTGTTAIEMALRPQAEIVFGKRRKHINAAKYQSSVAPFLAATFGIQTETVAIMRDPLDQIGSWYRYRCRPELIGSPRSTAHVTFDAFVEATCADEPAEYARIGTQFGFLTDPDGKVAVDHLFAYENQAGFLDFLEQRLGQKIELKRKNVSPFAPTDLSSEAEAAIRSARKKEFALYNQLQKAGGYLRFTPQGT